MRVLTIILGYFFLVMLGAVGVASSGYLVFRSWGVSFMTTTSVALTGFLYVGIAIGIRAVLGLAFKEVETSPAVLES